MVLFYIMKIKMEQSRLRMYQQDGKSSAKDDRSIMELNGMEIRAGP